MGAGLRPPGKRASLGIILGLLGLSALLALPASASAAITCDFSGAPVLTVTMSDDGDFGQIDRSGTDIRVIEIVPPNQNTLICGGGNGQSVQNTERIAVNQPGPAQSAQLVIEQFGGGAFEPGTGGPPEGGGTSEIEFDIDLGEEFDTVQIDGRPDPEVDHMRFGELASGNPGANLNAPETGQPDGDDLELVGVDSITVFAGIGSNAPNTVDGSGGPEFVDGFPLNMGGVGGGEGADTLIGGNMGGIYDGFGGDDTVFSVPLSGETLRGDEGTDTLSYARATGQVVVDLRLATPQDTGGGGLDILDQGNSPGTPDFENLTGSPFGDILTGTDTANRIVGAGGSDTIGLLAGNDRFDALDGGPDTVNCGDGADSGVADEPNVDSINANCETVDFPPVTSITAGPGNGATINDPTPTYGLSADEPAAFTRRIDGGPFQACPASCTISPLSDGPHTLAFRATDLDAPSTADRTPVTRQVTIDTQAPDTEITGGPKAKTRKRKARFDFDSELGASFDCSLDGQPFEACTSPVSFTKLKRRRHVFEVQATDQVGNTDQTPDSHPWKVKKKRKRR